MPVCTGYKVYARTLALAFASPVQANAGEVKGFVLAGPDGVFYPAKAWIERSKMLVKSEMVPHPVAVRYGFVNYVEGDVYCDGMPLGSFRSDDW